MGGGGAKWKDEERGTEEVGKGGRGRRHEEEEEEEREEGESRSQIEQRKLEAGAHVNGEG